MKRFLAYLLCVAAGFFLGHLVTAKRAAPAPASQQTESTSTAQPSSPTSKIPAFPKPATSALQKLQTLLATAAPFDSLSEAWPLIHQLTLAECKTALSLIREIRRPAREPLLDTLARRWATLDPLDAFQTAQASREDNDWRNRLGSRAGAALVAADPEAALAEITSARDRSARDRASEWILIPLAEKDPIRASGFLSSIPSPGRLGHSFRAVAEALGRTSPQQAIAWVNSITDNAFANKLSLPRGPVGPRPILPAQPLPF